MLTWIAQKNLLVLFMLVLKSIPNEHMGMNTDPNEWMYSMSYTRTVTLTTIYSLSSFIPQNEQCGPRRKVSLLGVFAINLRDFGFQCQWTHYITGNWVAVVIFRHRVVLEEGYLVPDILYYIIRVTTCPQCETNVPLDVWWWSKTKQKKISVLRT